MHSEDDSHDITTVFFSYSRVDKKRALPIIEGIEKAGYRVWWDGMLEGGTSYLETTENALETAEAVVVLWSKSSIKSHWVRDEAGSGRTRERLLPISLDGSLPPLGFRQVQLIDFTDWRQDSNSLPFKELERGLAKLHDIDATISAPTKLQQLKRPLSRRAIMLGGAGIAFGTTAGVLLSKGKAPTSSIFANSLLVRPFENYMSGDEDAYLVSGLSSQIRNQLTRNKSLKVLGKSSSVALVADKMSPQDIAKNFGVAYFLDGSVSKSNNRLDVSVELTESETGFSVWSETYQNNEPNEVLLIKDSITRSVLETLSRLLKTNDITVEDGNTNSPAAFDAYLRGLALYESFESLESLELALSFLDLATKIDPNFGIALSTKAQLLLSLASYSPDIENVRRYKERSLQTAEDAVKVAPDLAESHSALGFIRLGLLDISGAKKPYERSHELDLGNSAVQARYALYMSVIGEHRKALIAIKKALETDPLNETMHSTLGLVHYAAGRYQKSIESYERVLELAPSFFNARANIGLAKIRLGQIESGIEACQAEANDMERLPCLAIGFHRLGRIEEAQAARNTLFERFGDSAAYQQVQILAEWGDEVEAMNMLRKAIALQDSGLTLMSFDPSLENLRQNSAFPELLAQIGFKP
jgi:TolB-like protein/Tfp pilus assembly protein PilF